MSSFEFKYCRLTAQSPGVQPDKIQGNKPEFTAAFIAQMVGQIRPRPVYHAAMAMYCDDQQSMAELNLGMANWAWMNIKKHHRKLSCSALEIARVAELAVLMYLYPWQEEQRSEAHCASWVQVAPQTWKKKYRQQRDIIVFELAQMKSDADAQFREIMKEGEVAA